MNRHHKPDSDFSEETGSYPDTRDPKVTYWRGFLSGLIVAWTVALVALAAYLAFVR